MGITPIERLRLLWDRVMHNAPHLHPVECGYGKTSGANGNCRVMVAPYEGCRYSATTFCSEEHAALDQQEALF